MAVCEILKIGDEKLYQQSQPVVEFNTLELEQLVADLYDTMLAEDGAGLAAPQIGILKQVVIFGGKKTLRYPDVEDIPLTILINPKIDILSEQTEDYWEGCLSIPGMRGLVSRPSDICYSGYNQFGEAIKRKVNGFHARVVQHECDHLNGILYSMKTQQIKSLE